MQRLSMPASQAHRAQTRASKVIVKCTIRVSIASSMGVTEYDPLSGFAVQTICQPSGSAHEYRRPV